jgi:SAM-dependent methyltransferase
MIFLNFLYTISFLAGVADAQAEIKQSQMIHQRHLQEYIDVLNISDFESLIHFSSMNGRPLGQVFKEKVLPRLKEQRNSIIIDAGGGYGYASEELAKTNPDSQIFSVDLVPVPEERKEEVPSNMAFLKKKIPNKKFLKTYRGKINLILDVMGPIAYEHDPFTVINYYLNLLAPGGEILCVFGETVFSGLNPHESPFESIGTDGLEIECFTRSISMDDFCKKNGRDKKDYADQLMTQAGLPPVTHVTVYAFRIIKMKEGRKITCNPWESKLFIDSTPSFNIFAKKL